MLLKVFSLAYSSFTNTDTPANTLLIVFALIVFVLMMVVAKDILISFNLTSTPR